MNKKVSYTYQYLSRAETKIKECVRMIGLAATTGKFFQQAGAVPSAEKENIENWRTKFTKEAQPDHRGRHRRPER